MVKQRKRKVNLRVSLPIVGKNKQVLRVIVWVIFGLMLLISLLSMVRYGAVMSRLYDVEQELIAKQKSTQVDAPISPRLTLYMNEFIPRYMNIEAEQSDKRTKELASYFAVGMTDTTTLNKDAKRILKKATLFDCEGGVARYIVDYVNVAAQKTATAMYKKDAKGNQIPGVKETQTTSEHPVKSLLNIPYKEKDGQYGIIGLPYFTAIPKLKAHVPPNEKPLSLSTSNVDTQTGEAVSAFIDDFLSKYTTQSASDMSYMMREPASIKGLYDYVSANKVIKLEDGKVVAYVDVQLREKTAHIEHIERMKLVLAKQDNKYVVATLT